MYTTSSQNEFLNIIISFILFSTHVSKYMANGGIDKFTWLKMVTNEPYPQSWIPKYE